MRKTQRKKREGHENSLKQRRRIVQGKAEGVGMSQMVFVKYTKHFIFTHRLICSDHCPKGKLLRIDGLFHVLALAWYVTCYGVIRLSYGEDSYKCKAHSSGKGFPLFLLHIESFKCVPVKNHS